MQTAKARILVVDDEETVRSLLGALLRDNGYDACFASTGQEAIALLKEQTFDLVLTDMLMPDADGLQLMMHIRSMRRRPKVIPMSGGGARITASQVLALAVQMGALAPLVKPFSREQLLSAVESVLRAS